MNARRFRPLRTRLLRNLLWLALLCGGVAICGQTWLVYQQEKSRFEDGVREIGRTHLPLLSVGLWDIEVDALRQQVEQIAARSEIDRVVLISETGLRIASSEPGGDGPADSVLPIYSARLPHDRLGELRIHGDDSQLDRVTLWAAGQKILEIALFTGLISLLVGFWLYRELDVPLKRIAAYVANLSPENPATPPALSKPGRTWYDEMDLVSRGFETLHDGLIRHGAERDAAMVELAAERDLLDSRVAERTRALQRIAGYQEILSRTLMRCLHLQASGFPPALQQALDELRRFLGANACGLAERDPEHRWRWRLASGEFWTPGEELSLPSDLNGWCLLPDDTGESWVYVRSEHVDGGQLLAFNHAPQADGSDERRYLQMTAEMLFSLLERWRSAEILESTQAELERLSLSDPLTGLANRRRFEQARQQETRRAVRHRQPLSVLMLDVDHFKAYNDRYGHGAGDDCLVSIAECLAELFQRVGEIPARLGGEEFAILLPGYDDAQAGAAAERTRRALASLQLVHEAAPLGRVSVSLGYASWSPEQDGELDFDALLERADRALYLAKSSGRDQVRGGNA